MDVNQISGHFERIQELKQRLVDPTTDVIRIANKPYILKSGWRKLAFAFNLSDEILREEKEEKNGEVIYRIWCKVTAPNGRSVVAVGSASSRERKFVHEAHDPYALAHTRSKNRAISDILGLGEVSGEEVIGVEEEKVREVEVVNVDEKQRAEPSVKVGEVKPEAKKPPEGSLPLTSGGKVWGYAKRTSSGMEIYFEPPIDMSVQSIKRTVESFLFDRVLEGIRRRVAEENEKRIAEGKPDLLFAYTPIETADGKMEGISITADPEVLTDARFTEIRSSAGWTAARAAEKERVKGA
jgi:hypothetical protein